MGLAAFNRMRRLQAEKETEAGALTPAEPSRREELSEMKMSELREIAAGLGFKFPIGESKESAIAAILEKEGENA
jgi:hypothetical protein